ncbi:MAG: TatD family hydrolase [Candidatus Muiribacteriota bacterium]
MYIDSHAHITHENFDADRDEVINRAIENKIEKIINVSYDLDTMMDTLKIVEQYDSIYGTLGIHPHHADDFDDSIQNYLINYLKYRKIIALGEIGLDYFKCYSKKENQISAFEKQLEIAKKFEKPVVIHCRDAYDETLSILKNSNIKHGVMHCFSGNEKQAEDFLELGLHISFTGTVTWRKSDVLPVKIVPKDRLLLETDCPYMTPSPNRGKRNEPAFIIHTAQKIADIRNESIEELSSNCFQNTLTLFRGLD